MVVAGQIVTSGVDQVKREAKCAQQHFDRLDVLDHLQLVQPVESRIGDAGTVSLLANSLWISSIQPIASTEIYYLPLAEEQQQRHPTTGQTSDTFQKPLVVEKPPFGTS